MISSRKEQVSKYFATKNAKSKFWKEIQRKYKEKVRMVNKYKTKPQIIEAIKYDGTNIQELIKFVGKNDVIGHEEKFFDKTRIVYYIRNYVGDARVEEGDFVIKENDGYVHVCSASAFKKKYILA